MSIMTRREALFAVGAAGAISMAPTLAAAQTPTQVGIARAEGDYRHDYVRRGAVRLHTASLGAGPPVLLIHGFPDFWWTWRLQMAALAPTHRTIAMDQRGFNLSDKPEGDAAYAMSELVEDVAAVIEANGGPVALVGHDWGAAVSWQVAARHPHLVERLAILQIPHPHNFARELLNNTDQQTASNYAAEFQKPGAAKLLTPESLAAGWVRPADRAPYVEAFRRSSMEGMLAYYRMNFPAPPYTKRGGGTAQIADIQMRTLVIHGLEDDALLTAGHDGTYEHVEAPLEIVTLPGAGHFVQRDKPDEVNRLLKNWLAAPLTV